MASILHLNEPRSPRSQSISRSTDRAYLTFIIYTHDEADFLFAGIQRRPLHLRWGAPF
jgi:hypothetical protein